MCKKTHTDKSIELKRKICLEIWIQKNLNRHLNFQNLLQVFKPYRPHCIVFMYFIWSSNEFNACLLTFLEDSSMFSFLLKQFLAQVFLSFSHISINITFEWTSFPYAFTILFVSVSFSLRFKHTNERDFAVKFNILSIQKLLDVSILGVSITFSLYQKVHDCPPTL